MGDQLGGKDCKMEEEATTEYEGEEMARACSPTDREAHRGLPSWQEKSRSLLHQGLALAEEEGLLWPLPL